MPSLMEMPGDGLEFYYPIFRINLATLSPTITVVALMLARTISGKIDASTTRSPVDPRTLQCWSTTAKGSESGPILQVPETNTPWYEDVLLIEADVIDETDESSTARHDPIKLSIAIAEAYRKYRGRRRRMPRVHLNYPSNSTSNGRKGNANGRFEPIPTGQVDGRKLAER